MERKTYIEPEVTILEAEDYCFISCSGNKVGEKEINVEVDEMDTIEEECLTF